MSTDSSLFTHIIHHNLDFIATSSIVTNRMSKLREKFPSFTPEGRERKRVIAARPEYAAVPLNGWSAPDLDHPRQLYTVASVDRLRENAALAVQSKRQYDWVS